MSGGLNLPVPEVVTKAQLRTVLQVLGLAEANVLTLELDGEVCRVTLVRRVFAEGMHSMVKVKLDLPIVGESPTNGVASRP